MTFDPLAFTPLQRGARDTNPSGPVRCLQEWLNLHGYACAVDGDFGPETEHRLKTFQDRHHDVHPNAIGYGVLTDGTWKALTAPLARAMDTLPVRAIAHSLRNVGSDLSLGGAVEATARQWTAQSVGGVPLRELPGNSGPVVEACTRWLAERDRLPCVCGHEACDHRGAGACYAGNTKEAGGGLRCACQQYRPNWRLPWCAGWVSTVLRQACESLGVEMPIRGSLSCDELARQARARGHFWDGDLLDAWYPRAGDIFIVRGKAPGDWGHCGVVLEVLQLPRGKARLLTAEGNTNADGSRNGDRLLERVRPMSGLDFICWSRE